MSEQPQQQSFWSSTMGFLTRLVSFIAAVVGLITVLSQNGMLGPPPAATAVIQSIVIIQPTSIPASPIVIRETAAPGNRQTDSPQPTIAPRPSDTPIPSPTPRLTNTPIPSLTPRPTNTPIPIARSCSISVGSLFANTWNDPDVRSRLQCPRNTQHSIDSAVERFQQGFMLWRKDTDKIYVFVDGGSWFVFPNQFSADRDPEFACGSKFTPPSPRRGFSQVWCNKDGIQRMLGDAVEVEQGYCMGTNSPCDNFQDFENGLIYNSRRFGLSYVAFSDDGTWRSR